MPQLDTDAFAYSDGGLAAVSGGKWTDLSGSAPQVVSQQLVGNADERAAEITTWAGSTTLQYSEMVWVSGSFSGPTIFSNGAAYTFYFLDLRAASSFLVRVVAGVFSAISGDGGASTSGHVFRISMAVALTLKAFDNGVEFLSVGPEGAITSGVPGFRNWNCTLDDWAVGDFSAGGAAGPLIGGRLVGDGLLGGRLVA